MYKYFKSENLKTKRTFINKMTYLAPIIIIVLSIFLCVDYFQVDIYNWWYTTGITAVLSIGCCLLVRIDVLKKNRAVLGLPVDLKKVWMSKILVEIKNLAAACFIIFLFGQLSRTLLPFKSASDIPLLSGFASAVIMIITTMWQIPVLMFAGKKIGMFPTILISFALDVVSIIIAVKKTWCFLPTSYTARLMCPVIKILPNGLLAVPESATFSQELLNKDAIFLGITVSITLFVLFSFLTAKWYENQEAR